MDRNSATPQLVSKSCDLKSETQVFEYQKVSAKCSVVERPLLVSEDVIIIFLYEWEPNIIYSRCQCKGCVMRHYAGHGDGHNEFQFLGRK